MIPKRKDDMGMLLQRSVAGDKLQLPGHAQMNPQGGSSGDAQKDVFPPPLNVKDPFPNKPERK
jgi:hypothetical protein